MRGTRKVGLMPNLLERRVERALRLRIKAFETLGQELVTGRTTLNTFGDRVVTEVMLTIQTILRENDHTTSENTAAR